MISCSFAKYAGIEHEFRGKIYRWDFSLMFGPLWLDENFEPLEEQLKHHACNCWKAFEEWRRRLPFRERQAAQANAHRVLTKIMRSVEQP